MSWPDDWATRAYTFDGEPVTWAELAEANEPETMDEIADLAVGETRIFGQCDEVTRVA